MLKIAFTCLANSRKLGERCVAGLRIDRGGWIRPVSAREGGAIHPGECILDDGSEAAPLDVIEVEVTRSKPEVYQPENWELASGTWRLVKRLTSREAIELLTADLTNGPVLIENEFDSVAHAPLSTNPVSASLALVEPMALRWRVTTNARDMRQTRCVFVLSGTAYDLSVTDWRIEQKLSCHTWGDHPREAAGIPPKSRVFLTVSLGEPFRGSCYKLVAGVIVL